MCILKVFLLFERDIIPSFFLDFIHRLGSYSKGLPKWKQCHSVVFTVSVPIPCICEMALKYLKFHSN